MVDNLVKHLVKHLVEHLVKHIVKHLINHLVKHLVKQVSIILQKRLASMLPNCVPGYPTHLQWTMVNFKSQ